MLSLLLAVAATCTLPLDSAPHPLVVTVDGVKREALVVIGPDARKALPAKLPLVYVWHGFGAKHDAMQRSFSSNLGFAISVYPRGLERSFERFGNIARPGWQIQSDDLGGRDLKFFDVLHKALIDTGCVDESRVTSTGFSNGALFSNVLGCARADRLAGIAPLSGGGPGLSETCTSPVPALVVHGTKDRVLKFERGEETAKRWSTINGCKTPVTTTAAESCSQARDCAAAVTFCAHNQGHTFPARLHQPLVDFLRAQRRAAAAPAPR